MKWISNYTMDRMEKLELLCYYKVLTLPMKWYTTIWKWTWISCHCILQSVRYPHKKRALKSVINMLRKWNHTKCSFIHNCPNLEATKMPLSRRKDTWAVVHPDKYSVLTTNELLSSHEQTWWKLRCISSTPWRGQWERLPTAWFQQSNILAKAKWWRQ